MANATISSELLHPNTKVAPDLASPTLETEASSVLVQTASTVAAPVYGELVASIQKPSPEGLRVEEGFDGIHVDLEKSPFLVKNDLFDGLVHVLLRDLPGNTYDFDGDPDVLWEIQIQGKFQRQIKGPIYFALELPQREKYKVTAPMRLVLKGSLSLMRAMGHKEVHVSFGGGDELPHLSSPAFHSFDRVVVTKEGETPPKLGEHLPRMPSDIQRRKHFSKTGLKLDLNATYTFSVKNRRFDPLKWKVIGVPLVRSFTVSRFTEAVRLAVYEVLEENGKPVEDPTGKLTTLVKKKHTKRNTFIWLQMSRKQDEEATKVPSPRGRFWIGRKNRIEKT